MKMKKAEALEKVSVSTLHYSNVDIQNYPPLMMERHHHRQSSADSKK